MAEAAEENAWETKKRDIFLPSSNERRLDYATSEKLRFDRQHLEDGSRKNPGPYAYNPHLKMLCNDVSFLTKKASAGDKVLYIGGSVGAYILLLARMFPSVNFSLYDHNMSNSVKKAKDEEFMPANLNHSPEVFSEQVAAKLLLLGGHGYDSKNLLLMSDLRNITRNAWGQQGHAAVTDDNVINDLHLQENWVQLLRPKSSQIKFKLPYHGPSTYSYLKGDVYLQLFGKQSTSEVRLWVDAPINENTEFPRYLYNRQEHEDSLYHHNTVTRTQHLEATNRVRVSFDQHAAHDIFSSWKNRASEDVSLSGIQDTETRHEWIAARIQELDNAFDRALGLRICQDIKPYLILQGSAASHGGDDAVTMSCGGIMQMAIPKTDARRMWKRNVLSRRKRNKTDNAAAAAVANSIAPFPSFGTSAGTRSRFAPLASAAAKDENDEEEPEEGEVREGGDDNV